MKIDLEKKLLDARGKEFTDGATVAMAALNALSAPHPSDQQQTMEQAYKRWKLLQVLGKGGVADLTAEDVAEIKKRAVGSLGIIAFGALADALEGRAEVVPISGEAKEGAA
jgi:hypothetical protein